MVGPLYAGRSCDCKTIHGDGHLLEQKRTYAARSNKAVGRPQPLDGPVLERFEPQATPKIEPELSQVK